MATTKKPTTKAKTKTASAKSSTKKTAARKVTSKKATAKAASAKGAAKPASAKAASNSKTVAATKVTNKSNKKPRVLNVQRLRGLHAMAAGLFLLLAVAASALMEKVSYQLTVGHIAKDELTGSLAPAVQSVYDVEIRWIAVAALFLAAVLPILYMTKLQNRYKDYVAKSRMQPWRWIDMAVTGAIAVEVVALLSGVSDVATLKLLGGSVVVASILGLIAERQNNVVADKPVKSAFYTGIFTGVIMALFLASYLAASVVYGTGVEWHVYALYGILLGGFGLFARNMRKQLGGADYLVVERNYIVINMLVKAAFAIVLIVGLLRDF